MKFRTLIPVSVVVLSLLLSGCWDKGSGEKIGSIVRLQRTGMFCKTWEGEIIRGGLNSGSGSMGSIFHFTVEDEGVAQQVQKAMETQQEVKITYREEALWFCRSDSNGYFLTKVEPLRAVSTPPTQSKEVTLTPAQPVDITQELLVQNRQMIANQGAMLEEMRKQREAAARK